MKNKLAIFDFDNTIKQHEPGFKNGGGMAQLFPNKEIPQDYFKIMFEKSFDDFCFTVIDAVNNFNVTKKEIIEAVENDGYLINGMDQLLKNMAGFHKFK